MVSGHGFTIVTVRFRPVLLELILQSYSLESSGLCQFRLCQVLRVGSSHIDDSLAAVTVGVVNLDDTAAFGWFL